MRLVLARGFNLVDLFMTMTIVSLLVAAGLPTLLKAHQNRYADTIANDVVKTINFARATAINKNTMVTLCGVDSTGQCSTQDINKLAVFIDKNHNFRIDPFEELESSSHVEFEGHMQFNAKKSELGFLFKNDGSALTYGALNLCADESTTWVPRKVSLKRSGIPYVSSESDRKDC